MKRATWGLCAIAAVFGVVAAVVGVPGLDGGELAACFSGATAPCGEPPPGLPGARDGNLWFGAAIGCVTAAVALRLTVSRRFLVGGALAAACLGVAVILGPPDQAAVQSAYATDAGSVTCTGGCLNPPHLLDPGDANLWFGLGVVVVMTLGIAALARQALRDV